MKKWLTGFSMCWGMFCAIPNPVRRWDEGCYRQMLLGLPFLGGMLGLILGGDRLFAGAYFGPGAHFCPVHDRCTLVPDGVHPFGRIHGLQRRSAIPPG